MGFPALVVCGIKAPFLDQWDHKIKISAIRVI